MKYGYDQEIVKKVSKDCGSRTLKGASGYLSFLNYHSKDKFWGFTVDDVAFMYGTFAKKHFRLAEIAVHSNGQGKGYGTFMLSLLFQECIKRGIYRITFRTPKNEQSHKWYEKQGAVFVGEKGNDYEMRFDI